MAWVIKDKRYSIANIRKALVAFGVSLVATLGSVTLALGDYIPDGWVPVIATVGSIITGITVFLTKNAVMIDAIDGEDPEDARA